MFHVYHFWSMLICCFSSQTIAVEFTRTIVFIRVETQLGENVFLRGGKNGSCSFDVTKDECAIPIRHRYNGKIPETSSVAQWSKGDNYLDWHGAETGQSRFDGMRAGGTPLIWTTSELVPGGPQVTKDGYGFTILNKYGAHFWLFDVDMDCSRTDQGWFQFKVFISPSRGWEANIHQTQSCGGETGHQTPYDGFNHAAMCGKFNMFYYNNGGCIIDDLAVLSRPNDQPHCGVLQKDKIQVHGRSLRERYNSEVSINRIVEPAGSVADDIVTEEAVGNIASALVLGGAKKPSKGPENSIGEPNMNHTKVQQKGAKPSTRIMHGHPAMEGQWPWMLEILYKGHHGCGSVLITPHWAITAGHCVRTATPYGPWGLLLRVGESNRQQHSGKERDYFVKRIVKHPLFDKMSGSEVDNDNDIALLELIYPVRNVSPICLPERNAQDQFAGHTCWAIGWGKTDAGNDPNLLQEVKATVHSSSECSQNYGGRVSSRQICAGGKQISACSGDSGSPLSCEVNGLWFAAGVVSWGDDNCQGRPSVYTRIAAHLDWIKNVTGLQKHIPVVIG